MIRMLALFCTLAMAVVFFNKDTSRRVQAAGSQAEMQALAQSFKVTAITALRKDMFDLSLNSGAELQAGNAASSPMAGAIYTDPTIPNLATMKADGTLDARMAGLVSDLWLNVSERHSSQAATLYGSLALCLYNGTTVYARGPSGAWPPYTSAAATQITPTGKTAYANLAGRLTEGEPVVALVRARGTTAADSCELPGLLKTAKTGMTMDPARVIAWVSYPEVQVGVSDSAGLRDPVRTIAELYALKRDLLVDNELRLVRAENRLYAWSAPSGSWTPVELTAPAPASPNPTNCFGPGFLLIPASTLDDGTTVPAFCVSRGEMSVAPVRQDADNAWCYNGRNNARQYGSPAEGVFGAEPSMGGCLNATSTEIRAQWASFAFAKSACTAYGYKLLTSTQWQAIANNIAAQPQNWTGSTGAFTFKNGRQGTAAAPVTIRNSPSDSVVFTIPGVDQNPYPGEGSITDTQEAGRFRTHLLSTGFWIADFAGNLAEWVDDEVADYDQQQVVASALRTQTNSDTRIRVADYTSGTGNVWASLPASIRPPASVLALGNGQSRGMNLGSYLDGTFSAGPTDALATASPDSTVWRAALRGGGKAWLASANAAVSLEPGLYSYHRFAATRPASAVSTRGVLAGFRCTRVPL